MTAPTPTVDSLHAAVTGDVVAFRLKDEYKVLVTVESRDEPLLGRAMDALLERLPVGSVVRHE